MGHGLPRPRSGPGVGSGALVRPGRPASTPLPSGRASPARPPRAPKCAPVATRSVGQRGRRRGPGGTRPLFEHRDRTCVRAGRRGRCAPAPIRPPRDAEESVGAEASKRRSGRVPTPQDARLVAESGRGACRVREGLLRPGRGREVSVAPTGPSAPDVGLIAPRRGCKTKSARTPPSATPLPGGQWYRCGRVRCGASRCGGGRARPRQ